MHIGAYYFNDLHNNWREEMEKKAIVLAYSGGLDTSAIIPWLIEEYDADVIAYCSDLGNPSVRNLLNCSSL